MNKTSKLAVKYTLWLLDDRSWTGVDEGGRGARVFVDCGRWETAEDDVPLARWKGAKSQLSAAPVDDDMTDVIHCGERPAILSKVKSKPKAKVKKSHVSRESNSLNCNNKAGFRSSDLSKEDQLKDIEKNDSTKIYGDACYKCEICGDGFELIADLDKHNLSHSKQRSGAAGSERARGTRDYPCPECDAHFKNKNQRWKHIQRRHREGHPCTTCGKRFAFNSNRVRHEATHGASPPRARCDTCDKLVRHDRRALHATTHRPRLKHDCDTCRKTFVSEASYEHHLKYTLAHTTRDLLKYKCSSCEKGYRSRGELRDHVNYQHLKTTLHQCPVCNKPLATRRGVTRHVRRTHDGERERARQQVCQRCERAFRDGKGLREHLLIHSGERPLHCPHCDARFRHSASLYTHRRRVHQEPVRGVVLRHVTSAPPTDPPASSAVRTPEDDDVSSAAVAQPVGSADTTE